jgi:hypothetical protein
MFQPIELNSRDILGNSLIRVLLDTYVIMKVKLIQNLNLKEIEHL